MTGTILHKVLAVFMLVIAAKGEERTATAPFTFTDNRIFVHLGFLRPDGTFLQGKAFVDSGSAGKLILGTQLLQDLQFETRKSVTIQFGDVPFHLNADAIAASDMFGPSSAVITAGFLRNYYIVIDYRERKLTLAAAGSVKHEGAVIPFRVNEDTGLLVTDVTVGGKKYPVALDTGSAYTWFDERVVDNWLHAHPEWNRGTGAVGESNMRMASDGVESAGTVLRLPKIGVGPVSLRKIGALGIGKSNMNDPVTHGDFIGWYSMKTPGPVIGWLGGNVLQGFRITIDYKKHLMYWKRQRDPDAHDLDQVGLTLESRGEEYFVAGVTTQEGRKTVDNVMIGDKLLQIDRLQTKGASREAVLDGLHGEPGDIRVLILERNGKQFAIRAKVAAF